ncbi:MAG: hypothetical protein IJ526_01215 [Lachnospiraceae bacterium]|nr:hypothetical protein [Lachnospiraceae bacterium]
MKKIVTLLVGAVVATALTACTGNITVNNQSADDGLTATEETVTDEDAAQPEDSQSADTQPAEETEPADESADEAVDESPYDDPKSLPLYKYQGDDKYLGVISDYMIAEDMEMNGENAADVYIPYSIIAHTDERNPDDILVYGSFNRCGYDLLNSTLVAVSGSWDAGIFHLKKTGDGDYEVTGADLPMTEQESIKLFDPLPGLYDKLMATFDETGDELRQEEIAKYINTNGLYITQWQEYGYAPKPVLNAPPTPEEENFYTHTSQMGYSLTYDLRKFSYRGDATGESYLKIEPDATWTGTSMNVNSFDTEDAEKAIAEALSFTDAESFDISDSVFGDNISCKRAVYDEDISDGRIFRYICYAVPAGDKTITIYLHTAVQEGVSELTVEELEKTFEETLKTFTVL